MLNLLNIDPVSLTIITIVFAPLISFIVLILCGKKLPFSSHWLAIIAIIISLILSLVLLGHILFLDNPEFSINKYFTWLSISGFVISHGYLLDNLTAVMLVIVTLVASLVTIYSVGYMHGDKNYNTFFAYLSIFAFSMLGLVVTDNIFILYITWELVGLSSYLLIGFWFEKPEAAYAGKKAFITTRVGDVGMFIGILLMYVNTGATSYIDIFNSVKNNTIQGNLLTIAGILIFMGAVGKSAQFPLHVWLPDAMEGPTPVSALIHAATMVAAGVYMVGRLYPIFTPDAMLVITYIGGFTAFLAATIALVQRDIKRVLAYSTISQLGYMMLGLGSGGYSAGLLHLFTHASFKALLFLCSGSVIHSVHTQDIFEMGNLRKKMPITFITFLIGTFALCGIPPFSGFFSKDAILSSALAFAITNPKHFIPFLFGISTAFLTAFYMFRALYLTFYGKPKDHHKFEHAHESPPVMTIPLVIFSILCLWYVVTSGDSWFQRLVTSNKIHIDHHIEHIAHLSATFLSLVFAISGIVLATLFYLKPLFSPQKTAERFQIIYNLLVKKYYLDEIYLWLIRILIFTFVYLFTKFDLKVIDGIIDGSAKTTADTSFETVKFDNAVVDGMVNGVADGTFDFGNKLRFIQTGQVQFYLSLGLGFVLFVILWRLI
ncbi:MAG: NADH-quinone oxidoreductase subunit L [Candidatus Hydrogenedentota bacterium]